MTKSIAIGLVAFSIVLTVGYPQAPQAREFRQPRTAVVDLQTVYEGYAKSQALEVSMNEKFIDAEKRIRGLERELRRVQAELKVVEKESAERELVVKQSQISYDLEVARKRSIPSLRRERLGEMKKIVDEIKSDIAVYARGTGIDIVVEKRLIADLTPGLELNMVYYAAPEFEITDDVTKRLNFRYEVK